jgi:hypothetical protein
MVNLLPQQSDLLETNQQVALGVFATRRGAPGVA